MRCEQCGHEWDRPVKVLCRRCSSSNVDVVGVHQSWAFDDPEAAQEDPATTEWSYLDKVVYSCGDCNNSWTKVFGTEPYDPSN
jgi:hypothetical protein